MNKISDALKPLPERPRRRTHLFLAALTAVLAVWFYLDRNELKDRLVIEQQKAKLACQKEQDYALAVAQGGSVGKQVGDRRRLSDAEILAILSAQFLDSGRNPTFDAALYEEIRLVQQRIARRCEVSELQFTRGL